MSLFNDRRHAGQLLASALVRYSDRNDVIVLALPRGGVLVAYEVARQLGAPLDVLVVRKLGVPGHEELAMGALASGGICVLNQDVVRDMGISKEAIFAATRTEHRELSRREHAYRGERAATDACGMTAILVDDGLATGASMRAAIRALRQQSPARIVAAVPVAAPEACAEMSEEADEMVCAVTPEPFHAVGHWYQDFSQASDEQVHELLVAASRDQEPQQGRASGPRPRA